MMRATAIRLLCVLSSFGVRQAITQPQQASASAACIVLDQKFRKEAANGRTAQAETVLSDLLTPTASRAQRSCAGLILSRAAIQMSLLGNMGEAEKLAERSIRVLNENYSPDDPVLFRPLHILASARFQRGELGRARQVFERMKAIRLEQPEERALYSGLAASLLTAGGRYRDAESEYLGALRAWEQAGRGDTADAGAILSALGSLYVRERRFDDARRELDLALGIFKSASNAVPLDLFELLEVRAAMHVKLHEWADAEEDLRDSVAIGDRLPGLDPHMFERALAGYAYVLRKNHRRREARFIEARASALHNPVNTNTVIDTTELRAQSKGSPK